MESNSFSPQGWAKKKERKMQNYIQVCMNKSEFHETLFRDCGTEKSKMQVTGGHSRYFPEGTVCNIWIL